MRTTEEVWNRHVAAFGARDVAKTMEDFADDAVFILNGEMHTGPEAIGQVFAGLYEALPDGCAFELTNCTILDGYVYITWGAESDTVNIPFATDTFVIRDGKIRVQTVGCVQEPKG